MNKDIDTKKIVEAKWKDNNESVNFIRADATLDSAEQMIHFFGRNASTVHAGTNLLLVKFEGDAEWSEKEVTLFGDSSESETVMYFVNN
ncbi:hypothetical protein IWT25_02538 [Secundilactobacillus pentosiphilus]|uniref:Uncharacterized protein n=1 Tax=Secundilactobacillus pentosiphilus TaxID=1714682 RepID=A0A1Z5IZD0_9LACO|nr:hypothetical protein [Secundilactobacillus pentosiphilus]GAX07190.1 hypothetical protein IWT25_02538 [Secundilactobacillus pentosiphilus]